MRLHRIVSMVVLALVVGVFVAGCGGSVTPEKVGEKGSEATKAAEGEKPPAQETSGKEKAAYPEFRVGDQIKMDNFVFVVNGTREVKAEFVTPKPGNTFLAVDVTVENVGEKPEPVSSLMMFDLRDAEGNRYKQTIVTTDKASLNGEVAPGKKLRGEIVFEVPKEAKGLEFIIKPDLLKQGQAIVHLN
ncbi:DUF4352 domain-containing protein [Brockia lithotrophica]|uniref:Uncharacterized protein DUF4352 n=1 Tax=Brockia lithotrophica TaxID=933949 RepID=A0A660KWE6_9BACL|nr:DUF4352 domain-containing protein [Brockia lithotrophica]RKQ84621.1 uncharacterized protein DUF4352 [Brockia lithotrophica]